MRKYASKKKIDTKLTVEMIEQIVAPIKPGRNIAIWERRTSTKYDDSKYRVVTGKVKAVYDYMILVRVKARKGVYYNECFLKSDVARYKFEIK